MLGSVDALSTLRGNGQKDSVLEGLHHFTSDFHRAEPDKI